MEGFLLSLRQALSVAAPSTDVSISVDMESGDASWHVQTFFPQMRFDRFDRFDDILFGNLVAALGREVSDAEVAAMYSVAMSGKAEGKTTVKLMSTAEGRSVAIVVQ